MLASQFGIWKYQKRLDEFVDAVHSVCHNLLDRPLSDRLLITPLMKSVTDCNLQTVNLCEVAMKFITLIFHLAPSRKRFLCDNSIHSGNSVKVAHSLALKTFESECCKFQTGTP